MITQKGINRKWLVPIFFAFFQNHLTLYPLPRVISGKMIFLRKYLPSRCMEQEIRKEIFRLYIKNLQKRVGKYRF